MVATLPTAGIWQNSDGLRVKFGPTEADRTGAYVGSFADATDGYHVVTAVVDLATVAASTTPYILSPTVSIPNGAFIESVEIWTIVETTGVNANLDLGLIDQDCATELDFDGLIVAGDDFNGGTDIGTYFKYTEGVTDHGALVGTVLTNTGLLTTRYDTAAFTAGRLRIHIKYHMPITPNS
jgi:hypothetical protein